MLWPLNVHQVAPVGAQTLPVAGPQGPVVDQAPAAQRVDAVVPSAVAQDAMGLDVAAQVAATQVVVDLGGQTLAGAARAPATQWTARTQTVPTVATLEGQTIVGRQTSVVSPPLPLIATRFPTNESAQINRHEGRATPGIETTSTSM